MKEFKYKEFFRQLGVDCGNSKCETCKYYYENEKQEPRCFADDVKLLICYQYARRIGQK